MLKITGSPNKAAPSRNNGSSLASSNNDDSMPASKRDNSNNEIDGFDGDSVEHAKKLRKSKG